MDEHIHTTEEILGITRCVKCDHRLDGEIECPFCSIMDQDSGPTQSIPMWVYLTASFMTSPISLLWIIKADHLRPWQKTFTASGALLWLAVGGTFWV